MEYKVQELAELAGISGRTLRYYHELELLVPERINRSGYRIYGEMQVNLLQQILFYRELGMPLEEIKKVLDSPAFRLLDALKEHRRAMEKKKIRLNKLLETIEKTIRSVEEGEIMKDKEKFSGLKEEEILKNEERYGTEARKRYGDLAVDASNQRYRKLTPEQHRQSKEWAEEINREIYRLMERGDPSSPEAQALAAKHRDWICLFWNSYQADAHRSLTQMYVDDPRFRKYYDGEDHPGAAEFLRDAVAIFTELLSK